MNKTQNAFLRALIKLPDDALAKVVDIKTINKRSLQEFKKGSCTFPQFENIRAFKLFTEMCCDSSFVQDAEASFENSNKRQKECAVSFNFPPKKDIKNE